MTCDGEHPRHRFGPEFDVARQEIYATPTGTHRAGIFRRVCRDCQAVEATRYNDLGNLVGRDLNVG